MSKTRQEDGRPGRNGNILLRNGSNGEDGCCTYIIEYEDGTRREYGGSYDIRVKDIVITFPESNGVIEPG